MITPVVRAPQVGRLEPFTPTLEAVHAAVMELQEYVRAREPEHAGDPLDKVIVWRDAITAGLARYSLGTPGQYGPGGGGNFEPPPPSGLAGWDDLTPPDQLTTLTVDSIPTGFFIEFDAPVYPQGGGNAYSIIYRANYSGAGPLPVFADAVECGRVTERGVILIIAAEPGTQSHFWAQPVSFAEDYNKVAPQATPTGGLHGVSAVAGQLNDTHIADLSVGKLTAGNIGVSEYIQSTGFVSGSAGWKITGNGNSEFSNVIARGTIYATAGLIGSITIFSNYIESSGYNGTTTGFRLDGALGKLFAYEGEFGGSLKANSGTLGALVIASGGYVRMGQTAYATGTGFYLGDVSGTPKFSIGNATKYWRWNGTDVEVSSLVKFDSFTCSIGGGDILWQQALGDVHPVANVTVTPTGGQGPFEYSWIVITTGSSDQNLPNFSMLGGSTDTVTIDQLQVGSSATRYARLIAMVTDKNGRTTTDTIRIQAIFDGSDGGGGIGGGD